MLDLGYPKILDLFPQYRAPKRSESASFLIWYLENYYRLDPLSINSRGISCFIWSERFFRVTQSERLSWCLPKASLEA